MARFTRRNLLQSGIVLSATSFVSGGVSSLLRLDQVRTELVVWGSLGWSNYPASNCPFRESHVP